MIKYIIIYMKLYMYVIIYICNCIDRYIYIYNDIIRYIYIYNDIYRMATHALNLRHKSEPPISRTSLSLSPAPFVANDELFAP